MLVFKASGVSSKNKRPSLLLSVELSVFDGDNSQQDITYARDFENQGF